MKQFISAAALALSAASLAHAQQPASYDAGDDISYQISIPQETAQSGTGDFYFQMKGPATNSWIAMGIGQSMFASSIFVMYTDGAGNVTVSPRLGVGNVQPKPNPMAKVELLEGSGITNGVMTANVKCTDCSKWEGGAIDFTSTNQDFVWANRKGSALDSTSANENIQQHQVNGEEFTFDLKQATVASVMANPFASPMGAPSQGPSGSSGSSSGGGGGGGGSNLGTILMAHGIIMGLTVVLLIPLGALIQRTPFALPWFVHGILQVVFLALFTAGWGLGYNFADQTMQLFTGDALTHTVFGTVIFAFWWLQPFSGLAHHVLFKKKGQRTAVSHAHIWWGRIVSVLAIINGGLGLQLADNSRGGEIAYGVVAGLVGLLYIAVATFGEMRRKKTAAKPADEK